MATITAKLGLRKPAGAEFVNVLTDLNDNFDKIDASIGTYVCTSGTRPTGSTRFVGQKIFESDTKLGYIWNGSTWVRDSHVYYDGSSGQYLIKGGSHAGTTTSGALITVDTGINNLVAFVAWNGDTGARPNMTVGNSRLSWPVTSGPNVQVRCRQGEDGTGINVLAVRIDWIAIGIP